MFELKKDNKKFEFRNLEEQVQKNKEDIAKHYAIDRALSNFGIKIVGTVSNTSQLPGVTEFPLAPNYTGEYGDGYAVGQPGEYIYYIYTRPDLNAGKVTAYWLDVGSISIVGPEGPQGPQGEPGPEGVSTKWYTSVQPINPTDYDMFLSDTGEVYQYMNGNWQLITNIKGPQGVQGIRGLQGNRGPQGPMGPQGARGDVGAFIQIQGILSSDAQLPLPTQLNNLSIAYLVGASQPYSLYIQIGTTPEDALWNNAGPLNTATLVTVGGQFQNIWDADTKLNKVEKLGSEEWADGEYRFYVIDSSGVQTTLKGFTYDTYNEGDVAIRGTDGALYGPTGEDDTSYANKQFVYQETDKCVKQATTKLYRYVYARDNGNEKLIGIITALSNAKIANGQIPVYNWPTNNSTIDPESVLMTGTPQHEYHAATKKYVDEMFEKIYPVGSIYMQSMVATSPSVLFGFGTWQLLSDGYFLQATDNDEEMGLYAGAELPPLDLQINVREGSTSISVDYGNEAYADRVVTNGQATVAAVNTQIGLQSNNPIYGSGETVKPNSFKVFMWRRTS